MEENVKKILEYINTSIMGVSLEYEGEMLRLSYKKEANNYSMASKNKFQNITLNELLVILNRPELQPAIEQEVHKIEEEQKRMAELKEKYFAEIDALDATEDEKNRLKAMVKQMVLPSAKVGMGNRVPIIDPELEAMRKDYFEHREEYDSKSSALIDEIYELNQEVQAESISEEEKARLTKVIEEKREELGQIPAAPYILSQHYRLDDNGGVMLVTALDGNVTFHDYRSMNMQEVLEYTKDKELKIDHDLIQTFDEPEK